MGRIGRSGTGTNRPTRRATRRIDRPEGARNRRRWSVPGRGVEPEMTRPITRRKRAETPLVQELEARQLLSVAPPMAAGKAAEVVAQSFRNAQPAPQSPSPATTRVSVATDRPSYSPGQAVQITLSQAVAGNTSVNTGPMANYDVIVSQRGRELWRLSDSRGPAVASHVLVTMQPGESRQVSTTWNGRARNGQLVTGPVEIRGVVDRVESSPRVVQIGASRPTAPGRSTPVVPNRPTLPQPGHRVQPQANADLARARQQQLQLAAQARRSADRPAVPRPFAPGAFPARRLG